MRSKQRHKGLYVKAMIINHLLAKIYYYLSGINVASIAVSFVAIFILLLVINLKKKNCSYAYVLFVSIYVTWIMAVTILGRTKEQESSFGTIILSYSLMIKGNISVIYDIIFNVILYIPFGFLLAIKHKTGYVLKISFVLSLGIEIVQLLTKKGLFEIPDILDNLLGAIIGLYFFRMIRILIYYWKKRKATLQEQDSDFC